MDFSLSNGFPQIEREPYDIHKTAFSADIGYELKPVTFR